jgi:ABC-type uncharacterized transport system YnjBCD ATPase subunit
MVKGAPVGLIYVDKAQPRSLVIDEPQLALLRGLRDQAAQALAPASARGRHGSG